VGAPLIAVPTSVGYGWNLDGLAAWLACVNSCAPGVLTVNVDNGFGAGVAAARIARAAAGARARPPQANGEAR
jgi:NCAIR mutase (PurE)-related protein